ncbi:MAG: hypothetical protein K8E24_010480 [Methanobacterium paludis]|nr:hypothetical protein [Methanobacterium paludis]
MTVPTLNPLLTSSLTILVTNVVLPVFFVPTTVMIDPVVAIDTYLLNVYKESQLRGYKFNRGKIGDKFTNYKIEVTRGQILYELEHLKRKLDVRDHVRYLELENLDIPLINPIFKVVEGDVEPWELVH